MTFKHCLAVVLILLSGYALHAQNQPIGYWNSMLSYNTGFGAATDGTTIYAVSKQGFYVFRTTVPDITAYSKVNGMSDQGMQGVAYDSLTQTAILIYENGNIDIFDNGIFYNIPDLKLKKVAGDKVVYQIYTYNGRAYLSTSLGIIVIDLDK
ncbi:MAG: hypothetical protein EBZ77_00695, partial [Chitinophagia bacterium]|nr:hypothetical protein [Chitinophagia bacterium]